MESYSIWSFLTGLLHLGPFKVSTTYTKHFTYINLFTSFNNVSGRYCGCSHLVNEGTEDRQVE